MKQDCQPQRWPKRYAFYLCVVNRLQPTSAKVYFSKFKKAALPLHVNVMQYSLSVRYNLMNEVCVINETMYKHCQVVYAPNQTETQQKTKNKQSVRET